MVYIPAQYVRFILYTYSEGHQSVAFWDVWWHKAVQSGNEKEFWWNMVQLVVFVKDLVSRYLCEDFEMSGSLEMLNIWPIDRLNVQIDADARPVSESKLFEIMESIRIIYAKMIKMQNLLTEIWNEDPLSQTREAALPELALIWLEIKNQK